MGVGLCGAPVKGRAVASIALVDDAGVVTAIKNGPLWVVCGYGTLS